MTSLKRALLFIFGATIAIVGVVVVRRRDDARVRVEERDTVAPAAAPGREGTRSAARPPSALPRAAVVAASAPAAVPAAPTIPPSLPSLPAQAASDPRFTLFFEDQIRPEWVSRILPTVEEEMGCVAERVGMQVTSAECRGTMCLALLSATGAPPTEVAFRVAADSDLSVHCSRQVFPSEANDGGLASAYVLLRCRD